MIRKKQASGWVFLGGVFVLLLVLISQVGAQSGTAVGEPPQSLVVVEDVGSGVETAVVNTSNPQNNDPLGAITPQAYLPIVLSPSCLLNEEAEAVANLAVTDPEQERPQMICDPILARVAYERALDMGTRDYFDHTNPDGFGPNYLVEQAGYDLPSWYGQGLTDNNIESIAAGYTTAAATWNQWRTSGGHRSHVLGLPVPGYEPFYREQIHYGIGYAYVPGSTYGHYWVFITAP